MFSPYVIIIALFTLTGLASALWALVRIRKSLPSRNWLAVEARVIESHLRSKHDPTPAITVSYTVNDQAFRHTLDTPPVSDTTPEVGQRLVDEHPVDSNLVLFYNPAQPAEVSRKAGVKGEDWFTLAAGIGSMLFGLGLIFFSG